MNDSKGPPVVIVDSVSRRYRTGGATVEALSNVSLAVGPKNFVAIVGPSGAGKSTLLHLLGALDRPSSGSITVNNHRLESMNDRAQSQFRLHHVGFVFQFFNLLPHLSAWENVAIPRLYAGQRLGRVRDISFELLERVGMGARADHRPGELSGGQMQRVAIARALIMNPRVLLADEPTGNLDSKTGLEMLGLLRDLVDDDGRVVLMVTHDVDAADFADQKVVVRDGIVSSNQERP